MNREVDPVLTISRELYLKPLRPYEAGTLFALVERNRAHLRKWLPWVDSTKSPIDSRKFIEMNYTAAIHGRAVTFGIRYKNELAGCIGFHGFDRANRVTSLGYWLGKEFCGQGIMRKSVDRCLEFAFREQNMHRLYIRCATGNERSRRIPKALGFTYEGLQREAEWLYTHFVDLEIYSMLSTEWPRSQDKDV
jgi:ribosomal-protein-serine acetyltransferase